MITADARAVCPSEDMGESPGAYLAFRLLLGECTHRGRGQKPALSMDPPLRRLGLFVSLGHVTTDKRSRRCHWPFCWHGAWTARSVDWPMDLTRILRSSAFTSHGALRIRESTIEFVGQLPYIRACSHDGFMGVAQLGLLSRVRCSDYRVRLLYSFQDPAESAARNRPWHQRTSLAIFRRCRPEMRAANCLTSSTYAKRAPAASNTGPFKLILFLRIQQ